MLERANNKPILFHCEFRHSITRRTLASPGIYRASKHSNAAVTRRKALRPLRGDVPLSSSSRPSLPLALTPRVLIVAPEANEGSPLEIETRTNFPERKSRN